MPLGLGLAAVNTTMPKATRKNASDPRGGEGAGGAAVGARERGGGTSTTQPPNQSFAPQPETVALPTTPSVALATVEQQEAFAEAVVQYEGIKPACRAWGLKPAAVFYHAGRTPDFQKMLYAAQAANFEHQVYKLDDLCNHLLDMPPKEMNQCANAYGRVFDYRMRIVGKLLPKYGEHQGATVNIQNNTGIVCDEETRARLISLNQKLLTATQPKQLEQ